MAQFLADQLTGTQGLGVAAAGLGGANLSRRSAEVAKRSKYFSFTVPAGAASGDVILLHRLNPFDRFVALHVVFGSMGALGATLSAGKIDANNAANNDAVHYKAATASNAAGSFDADTNINEQVGTDPTGAVTDAGDGIAPGSPGAGFGSGPVFVTLTMAGGVAPTVGAVITGRLTVEPGSD